jgi:hypothetical protein
MNEHLKVLRSLTPCFYIKRVHIPSLTLFFSLLNPSTIKKHEIYHFLISSLNIRDVKIEDYI